MRNREPVENRQWVSKDGERMILHALLAQRTGPKRILVKRLDFDKESLVVSMKIRHFAARVDRTTSVRPGDVEQFFRDQVKSAGFDWRTFVKHVDRNQELLSEWLYLYCNAHGTQVFGEPLIGTRDAA